MLDAWLPLVLSVVALAAWLLAGAGWHRLARHPLPLPALAAAIVAAVSAAVAYLVASGIYLDEDWTQVSRPVANVARGVLAATGLVALAELVRSARRQR